MVKMTTTASTNVIAAVLRLEIRGFMVSTLLLVKTFVQPKRRK